MQDPTRLIDDPSTSALVRDHLGSAASAPVPGLDLEAALMRHHVLTQAGAAAASSASGAAASGTSLTAKLGIGLVFLVGAAVGVAFSGDAQPDQRAAAPALAVVASPSVESGPTLPAEPAPSTDEDTTEEDAAEALSRRVQRQRSKVPPSRAPSQEPGTKVESTKQAVQREAKDTARARALVDATPRRALKVLDSMDRDLKTNFFGEERDALRVLALSGMGRDATARRLGKAFLKRHPHGTLNARVRQVVEAGTTKETP